MPRITLALVAALALAALATPSFADRKTVCTITVNSPDEADVFKRNLPADNFEFVELVERGRPDWLASACRSGVRCDLLLISGHFDGGTEFYSDRLDAREFLPVDEMERASCSDSCPGVFSQLKEVYLFGCNTLDPAGIRSASAEVVRSLVRSGYSLADAEQLASLLSERHGESNRDHMRHIFKGVPVIYGFSGKAPLGRNAGPVLERYFEAGNDEIASGVPSARLLALFAPVSMTVASGVNDGDVDAGYRDEVCRFSDDRLSLAHRTACVHQPPGRDMPQVRMYRDRIEKYSSWLAGAGRDSPGLTQALDAIAGDQLTRLRYLDFARDADEPAIRTRMMDLAGRL